MEGRPVLGAGQRVIPGGQGWSEENQRLWTPGVGGAEAESLRSSTELASRDWRASGLKARDMSTAEILKGSDITQVSKCEGSHPKK